MKPRRGVGGLTPNDPPRHSKLSKHDTLEQRSSSRMDSSERRTFIVMTNGIGMKSQDCFAFAVRHLLRSNDALILLHFDMAQKTTEYKHVGVVSDEVAALDEKMFVFKNRSATEHIQSLVEFCASNNVGEHACASAVSPPFFFHALYCT
jgi:hypothetical protein